MALVLVALLVVSAIVWLSERQRRCRRVRSSASIPRGR